MSIHRHLSVFFILLDFQISFIARTSDTELKCSETVCGEFPPIFGDLHGMAIGLSDTILVTDIYIPRKLMEEKGKKNRDHY